MSLEKIKSLYPFRSHYLEVGENKIHYVDEGEGRPFLFVHGNPTWSFYYRNLLNEFKKTNRVIAIDHMGCGLSSKPQDYSYTLDNHIKNLMILIEKLDLKELTLVVHDWGGAIGFGAATRMPERFKKFVILNTSAFFVNRIPFRIHLCRRPRVFAKLLVQGLNGFAGPATFMASSRKLSKLEKEGYLLPYNNFKNRIAVFHFVQDIPMEENHPTRKVLDEIESKLSLFKDHKILILWGGRDFCFNDAFYKKWCEIYPNATKIYFKDASHYVIEDKLKETIIQMHNLGV